MLMYNCYIAYTKSLYTVKNAGIVSGMNHFRVEINCVSNNNNKKLAE